MNEDLRNRMIERISQEKKFDAIEDAFKYVVNKERECSEDILVFKGLDGKYITIHFNNAEIAIQLGYKLILGFDNVLAASQSDDIYQSLLQEVIKKET